MGRWVAAGRERRASHEPVVSLVQGALLLGGGIAVTALLAGSVDALIRGAPARLQPALRGLALKPALSLAPLLAAGADIQRSLERGRLAEARRLLGWHLVSRDTASLSAAEVAGAAI